MSELLACISTAKEDYGLAELREVAEGCPACILAAIRQSGIQKPDGEGDSPSVNFNFKSELAEFWRETNEANYQEHVY
jgi:hypothetical protein